MLGWIRGLMPKMIQTNERKTRSYSHVTIRWIFKRDGLDTIFSKRIVTMQTFVTVKKMAILQRYIAYTKIDNRQWPIRCLQHWCQCHLWLAPNIWLLLEQKISIVLSRQCTWIWKRNQYRRFFLLRKSMKKTKSDWNGNIDPKTNTIAVIGPPPYCPKQESKTSCRNNSPRINHNPSLMNTMDLHFLLLPSCFSLICIFRSSNPFSSST